MASNNVDLVPLAYPYPSPYPPPPIYFSKIRAGIVTRSGEIMLPCKVSVSVFFDFGWMFFKCCKIICVLPWTYVRCYNDYVHLLQMSRILLQRWIFAANVSLQMFLWATTNIVLSNFFHGFYCNGGYLLRPMGLFILCFSSLKAAMFFMFLTHRRKKCSSDATMRILFLLCGCGMCCNDRTEYGPYFAFRNIVRFEGGRSWDWSRKYA